MGKKHLDIQDIINYIECEKITPQTAKFVHYVNTHLYKCEECRKNYEIMLKLYSHGLVRNDFIKEIHVQNEKELLCFTIKNKVELFVRKTKDTVDKLCYSFEYPLTSGVRTSGKNGVKDKSVLVDEENLFNKIYYQEGKIIIQLDEEDFLKQNLVAILERSDDDVIDVCPMQK